MSKESAKESARLAMKELFSSYEEEKTPSVEESPFAAPAAPAAPVPATRTTVIGEGAVLNGSIQAPAVLEIYGRVNGDVVSEEDVHLYGKVVGNISCRNFYSYTGAVKGDIVARENIRLESTAAVLGNLSCVDAVAGGKISGNINASRTVELLSKAVLVGDVTTAYFAMREDACLKGTVKLICDDKTAEAAFADCFDF